MKIIHVILPLHFGFMNVFLSIIYIVFLVVFQFSGKSPELAMNATNGALFTMGFITINLLWQIISMLTFRIRWLHVATAFFLLVFYVLLGAYHHQSTCSFDLSVMFDNTSEALTWETFDVITKSIGNSVLVIVPCIIGMAFWLEKRFKLISRCHQSNPLWPKVIVTGSLYGALLIGQVPTLDELTYTLQTLAHYYVSDSQSSNLYVKGTFPLVRQREILASIPNPDKPTIFIVMIESFNPRFVETQSPEGIVYTPYFNHLISQGIYIEHYYGNSIQTCKGQFAIFFSLIPAIWRKEYPNYASNRFLSLPKILNQNGYQTVFFQCYKNLTYDNAGPFLKQHGFDIVKSVEEFTTEKDKPYIWGFGLQDDHFYRKFFTYLDDSYRSDHHPGPYFIALATTSNHMYFDNVPLNRRKLYPNPATMEEAYANSIYLSDQGLAVFFQELKARRYLSNSLVIITGDHGYPLGEHGYYHNEIGYYDEFFRTPFLMIWPGHIKPQKIMDGAWSHLDIAPTLLDLLQLPISQHHFQGTSLMQPETGPHPIFLVQPYNGQYLGVIQWPLKFVRRQRTGAEFLFNLETDPGEKTDVIATITPHQRYKFESLLQIIYLNQILLDQNAIWPPPTNIK